MARNKVQFQKGMSEAHFDGLYGTEALCHDALVRWRCSLDTRNPRASAVKTGSGAKAAKNPRFKWVNTVLGNIKAAMVGTYRAVRAKHAPRYLAEFEYRFNRRYRLETMIDRLAYVSPRTAPMPYRLLKLADVYA